MPFGSLRNRGGGKASNPQSGDALTRSPQRGRSITMPSITPRKSLTSLFDSYRRARFTVTNVSPVKALPDALEEELYPQYDPTNPDHDPERANATPPQQKSLRERRTPSPHPLKSPNGARLPKLHHRNRSQTSLKDAELPKTFLESLADIIRAPTSLFYKDAKQSSKINDVAADDITSSPVATPKAARASPKKSVTFQPGASFIEQEQRSSPIDIPKPAPSLPPVHLAFTPLAYGFASELQGSILTARPPETQILSSPFEIHQALNTTQPRCSFVEFETKVQHQGSLADLQTPQRTNSNIENPFADPNNDRKPGRTQAMLTEYDDHFQGRKLMTVTPANVIIDRNFVSNDEKVQGLPQDLTTTTNCSSNTNSHTATSTDMKSGDYLANPFVHDGRESDTSEIIPGDSGIRSSASSIIENSAGSEHCGERQRPVLKPLSSSRASDAPLERYDADHELSDEPTSQAQAYQHLGSVVGSQKWIHNPTHEDIRQQFKAHSERKGLQRKQQMEISAIEITPQDSARNASCNATIATLPTNLSDSRRPSLEELDLAANFSEREKENPPSYVRDIKTFSPPKNFISASNKTQGFPWTAELTLRSAISPFEKKVSPPESIAEHTNPPLDMSSSQDIAKAPGKVFFALEDAFIEDSLAGSEINHRAIQRPVLSSQCKVIQTPSPARIPLPASVYPRLEGAQNYTDQYNWCPFKEFRFSYAATAAIEMDSSSFRRFLGLQGCFYAFWDLCKLPDSTKPCRDTRGLSSSEIDTLFDEIKQATLLPEPARSALLKAFKAILGSDDLEFYAMGNRPMSSESIETIDAPSGPKYGEGDILCTQLNTVLFRMKDDEVGVDSDVDLWQERHANASPTRGAASHIRDAALSEPGHIQSISEEEKLEKVSKVLENFKPKLKSIPRRETMESQRSLLEGRRRSMWSDKSQSGASTSATSTMDALSEDEKFCQGIV